MATADETNVKQLPAFSTIKPYEQMAVVLRAEGNKYQDITNTINEEFNLAYKEISVRGWFIAGGRLEAAYFEYNDVMADQAVKIGRTKLKKATDVFADTLIELAGPGHESTVRLGAARAGLNKFIPDRQIITQADDEEDLPDDIAKAADEVLDGQKPVDDEPESEGADAEAGDSGDQAIPS